MSESEVVKYGNQLISIERGRQIIEEGYVLSGDLGRAHQLVDAAICYAHAGTYSEGTVPLSWPWAERYWKPSDDPVRNLVKAGALIAAAIDSLNYERID